MKTVTLTEAERLAVVREYPLGGDGTDPAISEACRLATLLCHHPMAAVELVLDDTVVIAAAAGLHVGRIARSDALSPLLLDASRVTLVADASLDPRFRDLRLVQGPRGIRFYAAVPLVAPEGATLGVLSVWDVVPGEWGPTQSESLEALGLMVMAQLNLTRRQRQLEALETEHARVEDALREAEAKFRGIFENTVVGIYQTTPDGHYLSANPMLARIYGYRSPSELVASVGNIAQQLYVDADARDRFVAALQQEDVITNFEAQIRRKDGSVIWISENARAVRDANGALVRYEGTVQDVTARRLAEDQLRTSELLYHSLVEELPQNILRKDTRERFIFANSRFCQTLQRPLDQILGRTDFDLYTPELAAKYQADDQRVMAEGRTIRATERNVGSDNEVHWVEVIKTPLRDVSGEIVGIQGIFWDVTEQKRLEDALAYERDLLQALLDHSPDVIYFKDPQSRFVKAGRALARRFNVADPEELVGKTVFDLLKPEVAHALQEEETELLLTGKPIVNQVEELVDHQGGRTWVSVTKVPIYNRSGQTLGLVGVARDITKLIETEQALREAEEKYRKIFENSVEGIFQTSPDGRLLQVNPALARIYGYATPNELMDRVTDVRTQVYVQPSRREEFVQAVLRQGSITGFESEIYRADGTTTWISESARVALDREGRVAYFEGTLEDISARKQIEAEQEKARDAAVESARLKSEFVATVSHEIRTPLNAIVPNAERLLETPLDRQQRYLVESIDYGAHMLLQIVNDILDLSKIEAGAVTLEHRDFDLFEVIERTIGFFASPAHEKKLELVGHIHPGTPRQVRGDSGRLAQVLNNLIGNSLKFTERGEVVVEVDPGETRGDRIELRLQVRDTGIGIAPAARSRIFQAFAQADGSMSRRFGGTGLGLAITRRLVELMGGTIDFVSEEGQGATFHFNVWLLRPERASEAPSACPVLAGLRVLVIEDNAAQRAVLCSSLTALGAQEVVPAADLAEANEKGRSATRARAPLDLVFFDAELPGSDLLQTARRLRSAGLGTARLIALTPPGSVGGLPGLEAAGVIGMLVKPLRQSRLASDLGALLGGERDLPCAASPRETPRPGEASAAGLRVLVVEDHPLNQRVACELLRRMGGTADAVSSGLEAVEAFERQPYDLILMDCQMPGMDGYETTRRIREVEAQRVGGRSVEGRVPIVALSANALAGDRERGIEAGMDDYLTKPLRQEELLRVVRRVAGRETQSLTTEPSAPAVKAADSSPPVPVLDPEPLKALMDEDDPQVLGGFITEFLADAPRRLERMSHHLREGNLDALGREAHALKGGSRYMGVRRLVAACQQLEEAGHSGKPAEIEPLLRLAERELAAAGAALEAFCGGKSPSS